MTEEEKKLIVEDVVALLRENSKQVKDRPEETNLDNMSSLLGLDTQGVMKQVPKDKFGTKADLATVADNLTNEVQRAKDAEAALQKQIDEIPTTGGGTGTGEIADGSVTEQKLSSSVANKLNTAYDKANLADSMRVNDGINFVIGALDGYTGEIYEGTNFRATSLPIYSGGEKITVNSGYKITKYVFYYDGKAMDHGDVNDTFFDSFELAGTESAFIRIEVCRTDNKAISRNEYPNIVKSFIRKPVAWSASCNMNNFVCAGRYVISGSREANATDNMPILNGGKVEARLEVLENGNTLVQILSLLNVGGGDGNIYTRTRQDNTWGQWGKLQTNVEVGVVNQQQMDALIDNGIYSGILSTTGETFVIICINNYAIAQQVGVHHISQLKYSLVVGTAEVKIEKRTRDAYGFWTDWQSIGGGGSYTLPVATDTTLGGVKSYAKRGYIGDSPAGREYALNVNNDGSAFVTIPVVEEVDVNNSEPVSSKAVANAIANIGGGNVDIDALLAEAEKRALRKLYIAAGAEYNDTDQIIKKTAFWGEEVDHLPKHYYLNGLGDITEEQMEYIYQRKDDITIFIAGGTTQMGRFWQNINDARLRTLFGTNNVGRWITDKSVSTNVPFALTNIEVIKWTNSTNLANNDGPNFAMKTSAGLFYMNNKLRVVDRFMINADSSFSQAPNIEEIRLWATNYNVSLSKNPKISKTSILYTIENVMKTTTKSLVITLHADVYAKCIEGGEWHEEVQSALDTANAAITGGGNINIASV